MSNQPELKMYIVVRTDLPRSSSPVQACHAVAEYLRNFPAAHGWKNGTMVLLKVANQDELMSLYKQARELDSKTEIFLEDDLGFQPTAFVAVGGPLLSSLLKDLRLL